MYYETKHYNFNEEFPEYDFVSVTEQIIYYISIY